MQEDFGNQGTRQKLDAVFAYSNFFTTALKNKPSPTNAFRLKYLDVFAGTGEVPLKGMPLLDGIYEYEREIIGSAKRALETTHPFTSYALADLSGSHTKALENLKTIFPERADRIFVRNDDANSVIDSFCSKMGKMDRAVVFLDPFGLSVRWDSLVKLAETKKVDLWYYFPAFAVARQIGNDGVINPSSENALDGMFGTQNWREAFVKTEEAAQSNMFEVAPAIKVKTVDTEAATRFMIERMSGIFKGGVCQKWLPLGRDKRHFFSLIFACANDKPNANAKAMQLAKHIMTRK